MIVHVERYGLMHGVFPGTLAPWIKKAHMQFDANVQHLSRLHVRAIVNTRTQ